MRPTATTVGTLTVAELRAVLEEAADGVFPPVDGGVDVVSEPAGPAAGVLAFTGHAVVVAPVEPGWVTAALPDDDFGAPVSPRFVVALADRLGVDIGVHDAVLVGRGRTPDHGWGGTGPPLRRADDSEHHRVLRALRYRDDVRVWTTVDGGGHLLLGRGVAGRWEMALEVDQAARGRGLGRALARAALMLVPPGDAVFAQVSPGNAASLRSVLSAGYRPVGAEILLPLR